MKLPTVRWRIFTIAIVLGAITAPAASGQDQDHALKEDVWALQFRIAPNLNLTNFQGAIIAAKYHFADTRALRFGIRLDAAVAGSENTQNRDSELTNLGDEPQLQSGATERTRDDEQFSVGVESQYVVYPAPLRQIKLFIGAGPVVDFRWSHRDEFSVDLRTNGSEQETRSEAESWSQDWSFGAQGVIGAEWFVARHISLSAEYGARTFYSIGSSKREQRSTQTRELPTGTRTMTITDVSESDHSVWTFGASAVKLGLTLYL